MLEAKIDTVRKISLTINTAERRSVENLERSVAVLTSVLEAKKLHDLPPSFAAEALSEAAAATHSFAEGNRALAACHRLLAADQEEFGVPRMGGDFCPYPTVFAGRADRPALAVVA